MKSREVSRQTCDHLQKPGQTDPTAFFQPHSSKSLSEYGESTVYTPPRWIEFLALTNEMVEDTHPDRSFCQYLPGKFLESD